MKLSNKFMVEIVTLSKAAAAAAVARRRAELARDDAVHQLEAARHSETKAVNALAGKQQEWKEYMIAVFEGRAADEDEPDLAGPAITSEGFDLSRVDCEGGE